VWQRYSGICIQQYSAEMGECTGAYATTSGAWQKYAYNRIYGIIRAKNG